MPKGRAPEVPTSATQQSDNIAHALSGAGGGLIAMTLTYPLITLSTRAQVEASRSSTSLLATIKHIIHREGFVGLYAGLESALFGISVTNFVYYYWYEWTRAFFEKAAEKAGRASKKLTTVESMIAGAIAGSATVLLTNPIWVVNTRMTTRKEHEEDTLPGGEKRPPKKAPSTINTLISLIRDEGATSLFAGVMPALVLVINPILQYTIFEQLKNTLEKRRRMTPTDAFYLGAIGKLAATSITYPYITVKSRAHVATKNQPVDGMWKSLNKIVKEEGVAGLYKGNSNFLTAENDLTFADLYVIYRNWTESQPERAYSCIPVCL
jgi:solute carrier family 25 (peroxisomal adenine nucleotide transporter), member 17